MTECPAAYFSRFKLRPLTLRVQLLFLERWEYSRGLVLRLVHSLLGVVITTIFRV